MHFRITAVVLSLTSAAAFAQNAPDLSSAASEAVSMLKSAAKDRLLIADLLGSDVTGPSADKVGMVENLVAIPGGKIVAALIKPSDDGSTVPVRFAAVKISQNSGNVSASLAQSLSDLRGSDAV